MKMDRGLKIFGVLSLFLSVAPFYPEPHLFGKIRWVLGGAVGMNGSDWMDLFIHGLPILIFIILLTYSIGKKLRHSA